MTPDRSSKASSAALLENPPPWPSPYRCAVAITFDVDSDSGLHFQHPLDAHRRTSTLSWLRYDRIAVPRLLRIFRAAGVKQTFFIPGWCAHQYPDMCASIAREGHELGLHGYLHESIEQRSRRTERELLTAGLEALSQITHERPKGWRGPGYRFSPYTADLLVEAGFVYDSSLMGDDVPYLLHAANGDLIELPVDWANDDWPQYVHSPDFGVQMPIRAPERALEVYRAEIDAARRHGGLWIAVWHPFVSGRLARAEALAILLDEILELGDVWVAPLAAIADHIRHLIDDGQYVPRTEALPLYRQRVTGARKPGRGRETPIER